ncbi:MAG TPA: DUF1501 domain-containing protein, partial [Acidobacteriota bacterium]|nr:DUF1501 domain-containing protein [Acidobacteriota bacterium]
MEIPDDVLKAVTRRHFFRTGSLGIGAIALCSLLNENLFGVTPPKEPTNPLAPKAPHFAPRAKNIIYLFMAGAPSQLDLFDYKPKLTELNEKTIPEEMIRGERFAFIKGIPQLLGSPYEFRKHGQSGLQISSLMPHLAEVTDDITIIKSMFTDQFNHAPAQIFMNTGHQLIGRPSMGAWLTYGLGSENSDLPGFVVLISGKQPDGGKSCWSSGFLPSVYQGVEFRSQGDPVLYISNPKGVNPEVRRRSLDAIRDLNQMELERVGDPEIATRIASYEMSYRMQSSIPELADIWKEPEHIHQMYGTQRGK